jgi:hypothetical protein
VVQGVLESTPVPTLPLKDAFVAPHRCTLLRFHWAVLLLPSITETLGAVKDSRANIPQMGMHCLRNRNKRTQKEEVRSISASCAIANDAATLAPLSLSQQLECLKAMKITLPESWQAALADELEKPYFKKLAEFVDEERRTQTVFPPEDDVFNALNYTPYEQVNVLLLGQDPYHDDNQAHGLCFSVRPGIKPPPSLVNM